MLLLAAPHGEDPHDGSHVDTVAGELLYRPFTCSSGDVGVCACGTRWAGVTSRRTTTLAEVVDRPNLTPRVYTDLIAAFLIDTFQWIPADAEQEAGDLAAIAADFNPGTLLRIQGERIGMWGPR